MLFADFPFFAYFDAKMTKIIQKHAKKEKMALQNNTGLHPIIALNGQVHSK